MLEPHAMNQFLEICVVLSPLRYFPIIVKRNNRIHHSNREVGKFYIYIYKFKDSSGGIAPPKWACHLFSSITANHPLPEVLSNPLADRIFFNAACVVDFFFFYYQPPSLYTLYPPKSHLFS